jgi:hypothetical protein
MPKITRKQFVQQFRGKSIDLNKAAQNKSAVEDLAETGKSLEDFARHDLYEHDGAISGPRELRAVFKELQALSPAGEDGVQTTDASGAPTRAGRALSMLSLLSENKTEVAAPPSTLNPVGDPRFDTLRLSGPVGPGAANNKADVRKVQQRLKDLGLDIGVDGAYGKQTERGIAVFKTMISGAERTKNIDDPVLRPGDKLHQALVSENAPRWQEMPKSGPGFVNQDWDRHDYGSSKMAEVIKAAGARYNKDYLSAHPSACPITTNDVSKKRGGDTPDHETHEGGLDLDIRLPRKDGIAGSRVNYKNYDDKAAYAMVKAFASDPNVERIYFSDPKVLARVKSEKPAWAYKVQKAGGHKDHIHIDVRPPDVSLPPLPGPAESGDGSESGNS